MESLFFDLVSIGFKTSVFMVFIGFMPGWLLCQFLQVTQYKVIWSHALSMLVFSVCLWISAQFNIPLNTNLPIYLFLGAFAVLLLSLTLSDLNASMTKRWKKISINNIYWPKELLTLFLVVGAYLTIVGVYDLVPSDILRHMERVQASLRDIQNPLYSDFPLFDGVSDNYHYYFYAYLKHFSGMSIVGIFYICSLINTTLLLWAIYQFSVHQQISSAKFYSVSFVILSIILFVLTKGIAGFSFVRYYSLAPTLLSFAVFMVMTLQLDMSFRDKTEIQKIILMILGGIFLLFWHMQELLFLCVMSVLLLFYYTFFAIKDQYFAIKTQYHVTRNTHKKTKPIHFSAATLLFFCAIVIGVLVTIMFVIPSKFDLPEGYTNRLITLTVLLKAFSFESLSVPEFFDQAKMLNPFIQLSQVLGLWGVLVYVCAVFHLKHLIQKPLLICALLIPFMTVFNPLFVDIFLRVRGEDVLYRLLYAVPISIVGAYILIKSIEKINVSSFSFSFTFSSSCFLSLLKKSSSFVCIILLVAGLFPFESFTKLTSYNRLHDILPVQEKQSLRYWSDITNAVNTINAQSSVNNAIAPEVLTDPVTGYIITATTGSVAKRYKFTHSQHINLNQIDFDDKAFQKLKGKKIIINLREGEESPQGQLSSHWPQTILKTSSYYSKPLLDYINANPNRFKIIWENNQIVLFEIH